MSFTQVEVTGKVLLQNQSPATGAQVSFTASAPISDGSETVYPRRYTATCASDGTYSITLNALDDDTTLPQDAFYTVLITNGAVTLDVFLVVIQAADYPTVELDSLQRVSATAPYAGGVTQIQAGNGVEVNPGSGTGVVVVSATGSFISPMTSAGDMIYGGAEGAPERLAIAGSDDTYFLGRSEGLPAWMLIPTPSFTMANWIAYRRSLGIGADSPDLHGAVHDGATNDQAAIQDAVQNAISLGDTYGSYESEVWNSAAVYAITGSPVQGGSTFGNAQIPIPVYGTTGVKRVFSNLSVGTGIASTALFHWQQTTPQKAGTVYLTTLSGTNSGTYGEPSVFGGPTPAQGYGGGQSGTGSLFSNMLIFVNGIEILTPNNPQVCGFDFRGIAEMHIGHASAMVNANGVGAITTPTAAWQFGLATPETNNNANIRIGTYSAEGQNFGAFINEHCVADLINTGYCTSGVEVGSAANSMPYGCQIHRMIGQTNQVDIGCIRGAYPTRIDVYQLNTEAASFYSINDPNGFLTGEIRYAINSTNAVPSSPDFVRGGVNLRVLDPALAPGWVTAPSVPSNNTPIQNPFYRDAFFVVSGGSVTGISTGPTSTNLTSTGLTSGAIPVASGEWIQLTYSSAPTWKTKIY